MPGDLTVGIKIGPMLPAPRIVLPTTFFTGTIAWSTAAGAVADINRVQILHQTSNGWAPVWTVVLPGSESQIVLPLPAVQKLRNEEVGPLVILMISSRSPKFAYNQWTYDSLSGVTWSSFTVAQSGLFTP